MLWGKRLQIDYMWDRTWADANIALMMKHTIIFGKNNGSLFAACEIVITLTGKPSFTKFTERDT